MKQVEIYIYECIKRLPDKQKDDIQQELTAEITEMVQQKEKEGLSQDEAIKHVLEELGNPIELANRYNDKKNYLIGPNYYNTYIKVLKIVMGSVFIGLTVAYVVGFIFSDFISDANFIAEVFGEHLVGYFTNIVNVAFQIFAWVTIIFVLIEKNEKSLFDKADKVEKWSIKELPKNITNNKPSKLEGIISLIVYSVFLIVINLKLDVVSIVFISKNKITNLIPIFNEATISSWLLWLNITLLLLISIHLIQLASSTMTKKKELFIVGLRIVTLVIFVWMISTQALFNPELSEEIASLSVVGSTWLKQTYLITVGILIFVNAASILKKIYNLLKL